MLRDRLDQADIDPASLSSVRSLSGPNGPVDQFRRLLEQLSSRLAPGKGKKKGLSELGRSLAWPLKKEEIKAILGAPERQKSLFHLALQNDNL